MPSFALYIVQYCIFYYRTVENGTETVEVLENGVLKEMKVDGVVVAIEDGSRSAQGDKRSKVCIVLSSSSPKLACSVNFGDNVRCVCMVQWSTVIYSSKVQDRSWEAPFYHFSACKC